MTTVTKDTTLADAETPTNTRWRQRPMAVSAALTVAVLAFLPIANWIPGGHEAGWYDFTAGGWLSGSAIAVGVGVIMAILSRKIGALWRENAFSRATELWVRRPYLATVAIAIAAVALYVWVALDVFDRRPLLIDEVVQVFQAQILAGGALSRPAFLHPEFFSSVHVVDTHGIVYSQFPVGGPAMLALGVLVNATWIVNPLFAAIAVVAFSAYARKTESHAESALGATIIFAFAPFAVFMSGSHMNHVTALTWIVIAITAMASVMTAEEPRPAAALLCGFGFGMAATIRPVDSFAFALPAGIWYLVRALRDRSRWRDAILAAIGVAIPMCALMWANFRTTGGPFLFGYEVLWGDSHRLGFHSAPWGDAHTPARGLELINLYFLQLQTYFLDTPVPSLVPAIGALALTRRLDRFDRYLLTSSALLAGFYFAYWHNGFYIGPRFMYPLMVPLAIWTVRIFPLVREQFGTGLPYRTMAYASLCAIVISLAVNLPLHTRRYQDQLLTMRWNADSAAETSEVHNALVLVRESWGAQLIARLWALGVPRSEAQLLFLNVDACSLEQAVERLENGTSRGEAAFQALRPLLADSARLIASPLSPDSKEQVLPGSRYSARCIARIKEDRSGFTLFTPLLLAHGGGNVYARDLHGRDTLLLRYYPNRKLYLLKPASTKVGEPPRFYPLSRDSLEEAWNDPAR